MGILSSLFKAKSPVKPPSESYRALTVDLDEFRCGHTALGEPISKKDFFAEPLANQEVFNDQEHGFEIGTNNGELDYIFLTLPRFPGEFRYRGEPIALNTATTIHEILSRFGEPCHHDDDTDEDILFYEDGTVELQFEFPGKQHLGFITIMLRPLMANPEDRKAYGVTKPWPPR